ncbi:NAD-dependent epimerase/dehydratase family protein [Pararobbsia silviterrae]|uniref:NAD-dependent epimerase/dehydratase family protein n=1 Tax=Pararobbsia silviterrae TaxID=1792498 RepID=A0A494XRU1_9BURK|nr:NAD(P)H-binding protein [Pararobbsia silviterrae]RKP53350.1 NAD-dependent epimerase/dehydratase family protein [Pararobbsia silviterrae]
MNVIIFGATGMVGQGVLRECLLDARVTRVLTVGRQATEQHDPKLEQYVQPSLFDYSELDDLLSGYDACFFCLGVSSARMNERDYARLTYTLTLAAAETLARLNPAMTFVYVSGAGTDSTEHGRSMWARVKGRTENALLGLPFKAAYMFRPGAIQPLHGIRSKTALYQTLYTITGPLIGVLRALFPERISTTEQVGKAMIAVALHGYPTHILESADIYRAQRDG